MHVIGVDVGGTNTDVVLLRIESNEKPQVIVTSKSVTSADVFSGLLHAIQDVITKADVVAVMLGTTHFLNALLQRRGLAKVCIIRLCGPATHAIPPMANWPDDLRQTVNGLTKLVSGGYFFDGSEICSVNDDEIRSIVHQAQEEGISTFCVCGVFSTCRSDQEEHVGQIIHEVMPSAYVTLSHEIAGLGLSERENAAILNACLRPLAKQTISLLQQALPDDMPFFLTKNNGTLLGADDALRWPIFTFASGSTNSMIGAAYLSGIDNAIVIDVGGTSMDIGIITNGKPRQTHANVRLIDDIRVNLSISDTVSLPLGGGTVIHVNADDQSVQLGPNSVAYRLEQDALAFGGQTMTGTDIAIAAGLATNIGHHQVNISPTVIKEVLDQVHVLLKRNIDRIKTNHESVPLILCGGGSILIDLQQSLPGITQIIRPDHFAVCNAVGAALCSISATNDIIVDLIPTSVDEGKQRKEILDQLMLNVRNECEKRGARSETIHIAELEAIPLAYQPGGLKHRVRLTGIGQLDLTKFEKQYQQQRTDSISSVRIEKEPPAILKPPIQMDYRNKTPIFDENGIWCIDAIDIEYIAYGTGILGCGGGGESYHCKLWCLEILREKKFSMRVVPPSYFGQSTDLVVDVGFMGAPTVSHELLSNGHECLHAVEAVEKYLSKPIVGIFSGEIGGSNGLMGLIVAANRNVPCIDCDSLGRAFPCLNHVLSFILGKSVTPSALTDVRDETILCTKDMVSTPKELEDFLRIECMKRGLIAGLCLPPIPGNQLEKFTLVNSLSRAWFLGQAKFQHRTNAIEAVARAGQGRILVSDGKIVDVERQTTDGFVRGRVTIETNDRLVIVEFQNENLIARYADGEILATVPDLITLVEQDSAEPLATEIIQFGFRVSILVLPAPELLTSCEVVKHLGPKAFGYDLPNYQYKGNFYASIPSVWDVYYEKKCS